MAVVDSRVDHTHDDRPRPGGGVPGLGHVHIGVGHAARLSGVVEAPEPRIRRIIRSRRGRDHEIGLDVPHAGRGGGPALHLGHARCRGAKREKSAAEGGGGPALRHSQRCRVGPHDPGIGPGRHGPAVPVDVANALTDVGREEHPRLEPLQPGQPGSSTTTQMGGAGRGHRDLTKDGNAAAVTPPPTSLSMRPALR